VVYFLQVSPPITNFLTIRKQGTVCPKDIQGVSKILGQTSERSLPTETRNIFHVRVCLQTPNFRSTDLKPVDTFSPHLSPLVQKKNIVFMSNWEWRSTSQTQFWSLLSYSQPPRNKTRPFVYWFRRRHFEHWLWIMTRKPREVNSYLNWERVL
jgi:hypothetical protein